MGHDHIIIKNIRIKNYGAYEDSEEVPISHLTAIIGKNDSGKSTILKAIEIFLKDGKLAEKDLHLPSTGIGPTEIIITFDQVSQEYLRNKKLLNRAGELTVKKTFNEIGKKYSELKIFALDFDDVRFQNLYSKKEPELNKITSEIKLDSTRSGRSKTNERRISNLTEYARSYGITESEIWITPSSEIKSLIDESLPKYHLFVNDSKLDTEMSEYQKPFQEIISENLENDASLKADLSTNVTTAIQAIAKGVESNLKEQTDSIKALRFESDFQWDKLIHIMISVVDNYSVDIPISNRGSGIKRLIVAALLKYQSDVTTQEKQVIYAIEEPETSLHPGAQRVLLDSLKRLVESGSQVLFTSHSPVFVAELELDQIILTKRESNTTQIYSGNRLNEKLVVDELGIRPQDIISGLYGHIFVEGDTDIEFFNTVSQKLNNAKKISESFATKRIGLFPFGGSNLKSYVERKLFKSLNRYFAVVVDSDKESESDALEKKTLKLKQQCIEDGGKFFILRKREIENYIHQDAYYRVTNDRITIGDFDNVKDMYFKNKDVLKKVLEEMTAEEIMEKDRYKAPNGDEKHELVEIIEEILKPNGRGGE
jgi:predicted ATP-dependent endonuclease of OLD family